ncbi:hypothetical protein HDU85_004299 [Gaertneriomyces sp. JEL0708]|nr:hypothetical protein HDU85_004299 [Gaertneriomyces sp. JEL0708]
MVGRHRTLQSLWLVGALLALSRGCEADAGWVAGRATHYGPYPSFPAHSEPGYQPDGTGVGCAIAEPGGDPRWNAIIAEKGTYTNPLNNATVWPKLATVAVSQAAYGSTPEDKAHMCFQRIKLRSRINPSLPAIDAAVIDWCPAGKCNWSKEELPFNVDLYGEYTWKALGGQDGGGKIDIEVYWPDGIGPDFAARIPDNPVDRFGKTSVGAVVVASIASVSMVVGVAYAAWYKRRQRLRNPKGTEQPPMTVAGIRPIV